MKDFLHNFPWQPIVLTAIGWLGYELRQWRIAIQNKWMGGAPDTKK